jgi:polyisoprenoid-binding protein YceI
MLLRAAQIFQNIQKNTMRNLFFAVFTLSIVALFSVGCANEAPQKAAVDTPEVDTLKAIDVPTDGAEQYKVSSGTVSWTASEAVGGGHQGVINIKNGVLLVNQGELLRGNATLDMNSLSVTDLKDPAKKAKLESHLKDQDFFETNKHPEGVFVIKEVLPGTGQDFNRVISGELTLKGITKPVNVPVRISIENGVLRAETPAFSINRTDWGVNFRSGILGTAKDKLINDAVQLSVVIEARP